MREFAHGVGYVVVSLATGGLAGLMVGSVCLGLGAKEEGAIALGVIVGLITFFVTLACIADQQQSKPKDTAAKNTTAAIAAPAPTAQPKSDSPVLARFKTQTVFKGNYVTIKRRSIDPVQQDTLQF